MSLNDLSNAASSIQSEAPNFTTLEVIIFISQTPHEYLIKVLSTPNFYRLYMPM